MSTPMTEAEKTFLGTIINNPESFDDAVAGGANADCFQNDQAKEVWQAMVAIREKGGNVDLMTLASAVPTNCLEFALNCSAQGSIIGNISFMLDELLHQTWRRNAGNALSSFLNGLMAPSYRSSEINRFKAEFKALSDKLLSDEKLDTKFSMMEAGKAFFDEFEKRHLDYLAGVSRGISTGLPLLDEVIGGWVNGRLYILGARTSVGKTAMAVNFANTAAFAGKKVLFFSNEMSATEILERLLSINSQVSSLKITKGSTNALENDRIVAAIREVCPKPISVDERAGRFIEKFEQQVRRTQYKEGVDFVVLDYIQQVHSHTKKFAARHLEVGYISDRLKALARELKVPILALAQINRDVEKNGKSLEPNLSHLKDSGSLEQDADCVLLLHRQKTNEEEKTSLIVAKNRFGKCVSIPLKAELATNKFSELKQGTF